MKTNMNMSMRIIALRAVRTMAIDGSLGAACGALYGFVFGGFGAVVNSEPERLISIAGYYALCGAVAGAVVGAWGVLLNRGETTSEVTPSSPAESTTKRRVADAARHLMVPSHRCTENLGTASGTEQRRALTAAANHPLSC